jgi:magnesium-transporting ATPase (P-type)
MEKPNTHYKTHASISDYDANLQPNTIKYNNLSSFYGQIRTFVFFEFGYLFFFSVFNSFFLCVFLYHDLFIFLYLISLSSHSQNKENERKLERKKKIQIHIFLKQNICSIYCCTLGKKSTST